MSADDERGRVVYEVADRVATVTLDEPEKRNRLTTATIRQVVACLERARDDDGVRAIVLCGAGDKAFCAGADIEEFIGNSNLENRAQYDAYARLCTVFDTLGKPSIAAVRGYALAGGLGLAIFPDLTVAADDAQFGVPEIRIGLWPMMVSVALVRAVGRKKALELMYSGDIIDAREAERIGLINRVVPAGELERAVENLAGELAARSPVAMRLGRDSLYNLIDMERGKAVEYAREMIVVLLGTEDAQEGCRAFVEKRQPTWKGR